MSYTVVDMVRLHGRKARIADGKAMTAFIQKAMTGLQMQKRCARMQNAATKASVHASAKMAGVARIAILRQTPIVT
jgi:hypothetical protein